VLFQNQEVAFVIAETREAAADAADLVEVEYEQLEALDRDRAKDVDHVLSVKGQWLVISD